MNLITAAATFEISAGHLRHLVQDAQRPATQRRYEDWQHEYYLTTHFVRDTKGKKNVTRGNFPYYIDDVLVEQWKRRRKGRLVATTPARLRRDVYRQLADVGIDLHGRERG